MALREYVLGEITADYSEALITRREALRRLGLVGLSATAAASLLAACGGDSAKRTESRSTTTKPTRAPAPPTSESITFDGPRGDLFGAFAAAAQPSGALLIIHEIFGLTEHIRSLPERFAAEGYSALAIDLLSEEGGTDAPGVNPSGALTSASEQRLIADLGAGLDELERRARDAKLAVVGFCFGGGMVWQWLDAGESRLAAAVPFYGPCPPEADFSGSRAAVLGIYGELDERVNGSRAAATAALEAAGLEHRIETFAGANHGFFNDTSPRYHEQAATDAFDLVLDWFSQHLA
jgi:carboxymethylenebutenolidase